MEFEKLLKRAEHWIVYGLVILLPVFVLSSYANVIETPKVSLLVLSIMLVLLIGSVRALMTNKIRFSSSVLDVPVFLLGMVYVASAILKTPNKMEAFFLPGTATVVLSGVLLYFIINQMNKDEKRGVLKALFFSSVLYSTVVLFATAGLFRVIPQLPAFMQNNGFNPIGSSLAALVFLAITLPIGIFSIIKESDVAKKALYGVSVGIMTFAFVLNAFNILPGKPTSPRLPGVQTSWSIAIDTLKVSPLLGVGPGNYLTAFNRFRPIEYNLTDLWSTRFTSGSSYIFTMMTETGIAGVAAFAILLLAVYRIIKEEKLNEYTAALGLSSLLLVVLPSTAVLLVVFFILLALSSKSKAGVVGLLNYDSESNSRLPILVLTVPVLAFIGVTGYYLQKISFADFAYKQALRSISQNNGSDAYEYLQKAITRNPLVDRYRVSYAQINLALANSVASQENISEQDRQTIAELIQQAIREGKAAVALNPQRAGNWEVLASIYRSVAPLADGAANFAVQTYNQAINLDRLNTNTRIALGGLYYSAGQYENAIDIFEAAVLTRPTHANARYNLAVAYRDAGYIDRAIEQVSQVLSLIDRNSDDYQVATQLLEDLQNRQAEATQPGSSTNLEVAGTEETAELEPPIELDEEAQPPEAPVLGEEDEQNNENEEAAEATPEPTEEPTPSPTPAP